MLEFKVRAELRSEKGEEQFIVYNIKKLSHYLAYSHLLEFAKNLKCKLVRHQIEEVSQPSNSPKQLALPSPSSGAQKPHIVRPAVVVPPTPAAVPWYEDSLTVSKSHIQHTTVITEWRDDA